MVQISKLMLIRLFWFGVCMHGAGTILTNHLYEVPGFTPEDIGFVRTAYLEYQDSIKSQSRFAKMVSSVRSLVAFEPNAMQYCNTLLSRFYRSQLDAMAKAAPLNFHILQEAIRVACEKIDEIGAHLIKDVKQGDATRVNEGIKKLQYHDALQIALNVQDDKGDTALMWACQKNYVEIIKKLLSFKDTTGKLLVDLNAQNRWGDTALIWACRLGNFEAVEALLSVKDASGKLLIDVNAKNREGDTALIWASKVSRSSGIVFLMVQKLLEHGADILAFNNINHQSALGILRKKSNNLEKLGKKQVKINSILKVFDALRPDVTDETLKDMLPEARVLKEAYVEFQEGNHQELRNVLFEMPLVYMKRMGRSEYMSDTMVVALQQVFKKESIRPLLIFLIDSQKEQELANNYLSELGLPVIDLVSLRYTVLVTKNDTAEVKPAVTGDLDYGVVD